MRQGFDHILDFARGDKLDLSGLALGLGAPSDYIKVTDTAAGTVISANFGGSTGFVDVVMLDRVHTVTLSGLLSDHAIIL